jgi:dihydroorotate dehydrogenase (NAD+) catalytic subunit
MVWELVEVMKKENWYVPVVGLGGIASASDALEFLLAGASAIQVGTATFVRPPVMNEIREGIEAYMKEKGFSKLSELNLRQA